MLRSSLASGCMVPADEVAFPTDMLQQHLTTAAAACPDWSSLLAALQGVKDARPARTGPGQAWCPRDLLLHSSHLTLNS